MGRKRKANDCKIRKGRREENRTRGKKNKERVEYCYVKWWTDERERARKKERERKKEKELLTN